MSETQSEDRVRIPQVLAGALAAVTAALVGSTMGVAGTVVGAGLASIVSAIGGTLYLKSIQRTRDSVRVVRAKVVGRSGGATVLVSDEDPEQGEEVDASPDAPPSSRRLRWPMIVVGSIAAFALGMLAVTGIEWLRGEPLSGGSGTTFSSIVEPHRSGEQRQVPSDQPSDAPTTSTQESSTPPPTTTTTTPPPSSTGSQAPTTTTTPPATTTTTEPNLPGGTPPPSG